MKRIAVTAVIASLLLATSTFAIDSPRPPTKAGSTPAPPTSGSAPPGAGSAPPPSSGSGTSQNPGWFADVVGRTMPLHYCRAGEPCDVAVHFSNIGAAVAANQPIPDPAWTINGQPASPSGVQRNMSELSGNT